MKGVFPLRLFKMPPRKNFFVYLGREGEEEYYQLLIGKRVYSRKYDPTKCDRHVFFLDTANYFAGELPEGIPINIFPMNGQVIDLKERIPKSLRGIDVTIADSFVEILMEALVRSNRESFLERAAIQATESHGD